MTVRLRPAVPEDYAQFERWFPMLGSGDPTPSVERWCDELAPDCEVAELNGRAVGYCLAQVFGRDGYIRHVVVDPQARRSGTGRTLVVGATTKMRKAACERWRLNVRPENLPAVRLYESLGLAVHHECTSLRFPPSLVDRLPQPWPRAAVVEPGEHDFARLEQRFELPQGQLASASENPAGCVLAILGEASQPWGVATFDSVRQGSFPFRAESLAAASALLHALRGRATGPEMGVVSEDVGAFTQQLIEAGARVPFRFVHMRGPL